MIRRWKEKGIGQMLLAMCMLAGGFNGYTQSTTGNAGLYYAYPGQDLQEKIRQHMYIKVELSKTTAYEGEAIEAAYYLWVALDIQGKITKAPSYKGFAAFDLSYGNGGDYTVEEAGGFRYKKYLIKRVQLFGLQAGMQRLEPVAMEADVRFLKLDKGKEPAYEYPAAAPADTIVATTLQSAVQEVRILPLPGGSPPNFQSAVGNFSIEARLLADTLLQQQTGTLVVTLTGKGNWHQVVAPAPLWPEGFTLFEPTRSDIPDTIQTAITGSVQWRFPFILHRPGQFVIPAVAFSYFNPVSGNYQTVQSNSIPLLVKKEVALADKGLAGQKSGTDSTRIFTNVSVILFPVAALGLLAWLWWQHKRSQKSKSQTSEKVKPSPKASAILPIANLTAPGIEGEICTWIFAQTKISVQSPYDPALYGIELPWRDAVKQLWKKCKAATATGCLPDDVADINRDWEKLKATYGSGTKESG